MTWAVRRVFARTWIEEFTGTEAEVDEYLAAVLASLPAEKHDLVCKASMLSSDWTPVP